MRRIVCKHEQKNSHCNTTKYRPHAVINAFYLKTQFIFTVPPPFVGIVAPCILCVFPLHGIQIHVHRIHVATEVNALEVAIPFTAHALVVLPGQPVQAHLVSGKLRKCADNFERIDGSLHSFCLLLNGKIHVYTLLLPFFKRNIVDQYNSFKLTTRYTSTFIIQTICSCNDLW